MRGALMPLVSPLVEKPCRSPSRNVRQWQSSRNGSTQVKRALLFVVASAFALAACNTSTSQNATQEQKQGTDIGIQTSWLDKSVVPGDDFFSYADGTWVKNTQIPPDRSRIGGFFIADQLREKNTRALFNDILKANPTSGTDALI